MSEVNDIKYQTQLTDICRLFKSNTKEYTMYFEANRHMLRPKQTNEFIRIVITSSILSD